MTGGEGVSKGLAPKVIGEAWGPLRILERIGAGRSGEVFRANDPALAIDVALKLWFPDSASAIEALLDQARILARIRHPNLLAVIGVATHSGREGMWSELVRGQSIEAILHARGSFGASEAAILGTELCRALAPLHAFDRIHGDVRSGNVVREERGRVVLMDLAPPPSERRPFASLPLARASSLAPEQLLEGRAVTGTDIHGVGAVLYRMTSTRWPVESGSIDELVERHRSNAHPSLRDHRPDLPLEFITIVEKCLALNPAERFPSAAALERALLSFLGDPSLGSDARRSPRTKPPIERTLDERRHNLPAPPTRLFGREHETRECIELLGTNRLLTLVGTGGCGKTRLGLGIAETWLRETSDETFFVDLAPIDEDSRVPEVVASTLGVRVSPRQSAIEALVAHRRDRRHLMVLDNAEHVRNGCATLLLEMLARNSEPIFVVTSREALGVPGEQIYPVPPLAIPDAADADVDTLGSYASVQLFLDRATQASAGFELTSDNAPAVAEICRRVDGIPLALELIAARMKAITAEDARSRLDQVLRLATSRPETEHRQRTIAATIGLSHDRLDDAERALFEKLSVFRSGWTLESARAISLVDRDEYAVLETISGLAEKSLIVLEPSFDGRSRYRFLEVVRQFARERLAESGHERAARDAFLDYFVALAETSREKLWGPEQSAWLKRLELEHDNLISAIEWGCGSPDRIEKALRLAGALFRFWYNRGHYHLGRRTLLRVLASPGAATPSSGRLRALFGAAGMAVYQADYAAAREMYDEGLAFIRENGGGVESGGWMIGRGLVATHEGDLDLAERLHHDALDLFRASGNRAALPIVLLNLSEIATCRGNEDLARAHAREALEIARATDNRVAVAAVLATLGALEVAAHGLEKARADLVECLEIVRDLDLRQSGVEALESAASLALATGDGRGCVRLLAAGETFRTSWGVFRSPAEQRRHESRLASAHSMLDDGAFHDAEHAGRMLSFETALHTSIDWLGSLDLSD